MTWLDRRSVRIGCLGHAAGERGEFHCLQEADQFRPILWLQHQPVQIDIERHIRLERHQFARDLRLVGKGQNVFAALVLLDFRGAGQKRVEIAKLFQQLRRRFRTYAGNARNIVGAVAGQRLQVDHLFRRHAPFLDHFRDRNLLVLHAVIHRHAWCHELHQILVGGDDRDIAARFLSQTRIGGDKVVSLEAFLLDAGQVEGAGRLPDEAELRDQVFRGAVRFAL